MPSITTDGSRSFTEKKHVCMIKLLENKLKAEHLGSYFLSFYCTLIQENLCKVALDLKHVVNIIRARAVYHQQFKSLLEDVEAEYGDVIDHNSVWCLSLGKMLKQVWELQNEILFFGHIEAFM
ncbi:hypothetical protein BsWGS_24050 [Bradybaena similaris]